jgi:hypothetical protein
MNHELVLLRHDSVIEKYFCPLFCCSSVYSVYNCLPLRRHDLAPSSCCCLQTRLQTARSVDISVLCNCCSVGVSTSCANMWGKKQRKTKGRRKKRNYEIRKMGYYGHPKISYVFTKLHCITSQTTATFILPSLTRSEIWRKRRKWVLPAGGRECC